MMYFELDSSDADVDAPANAGADAPVNAGVDTASAFDADTAADLGADTTADLGADFAAFAAHGRAVRHGAHLDLPQATYVAKIDEISPQRIRVRRLIEEGYEILDVPLPAVITVVKEINVPRLPSLKGKMKAKKAEIRKVTVQALGINPSKVGLAGSPTQVWKVFTPPKPKGGEKWTGEVAELVEKVYAKLKERQLL